MKKSILNRVIDEKAKCYFISPHFDDAILSAGGLISYLSRTNEITIVNIFTRASEFPYTFSAKRFLGSCGYKDANLLFKDREKEDAKVLTIKNIKVINLGYTDAIFRKRQDLNIFEKLSSKFIPEISHIYPIFENSVKVGKISGYDKSLVKDIKKNLVSIVSKKAIVFCPLGIGKHIDHLIVNKVCSKLFGNCIYWVDFPYSIFSSHDSIKMKNYFFYQIDEKEKSEMIKGYKSQFKSLFPNGLNILPPELFFYNSFKKTPRFQYGDELNPVATFSYKGNSGLSVRGGCYNKLNIK